MSKELEESKERLITMFKKNPEIAEAYKETLIEMGKPENREKLVKDICLGLEVLKTMKSISDKNGR